VNENAKSLETIFPVGIVNSLEEFNSVEEDFPIGISFVLRSEHLPLGTSSSTEIRSSSDFLGHSGKTVFSADYMSLFRRPFGISSKIPEPGS